MQSVSPFSHDPSWVVRWLLDADAWWRRTTVSRGVTAERFAPPSRFWYRTVPGHRRRWPTVLAAAALAVASLAATGCLVAAWWSGLGWLLPGGLVAAWGGDAWARRMPWAPPTTLTAADLPALPTALLIYARQPSGVPPTPLLPDRRVAVPPVIRGGGAYRAIASQWPPPMYRP